MAIPIRETKVIAVEGKEEVFFFSAVLNHLNLAGIQVLDYKGTSQLRPYLNALKSTRGFDRIISLGVVRDANASAPNALQHVQDALRNSGLPIPPAHLVPIEGSPKVTVLIMPNGINPGALEDLCLASVSTNPIITCVDQYFQCIQTRTQPLPSNMAKARVHTFLASKPNPELRLGVAAQAGYWPLDNPAFDDLKQFLNSL